MLSVEMNKKNTRKLLKASNQLNTMTKLRLDWLLDSDRICGCLGYNFFGRLKDMFLIQRINDDEYRLIYDDGQGTNIYAILDVEAFLQMIGTEELICDDFSIFADCMETLAKYPPTGQVEIIDDKIYLLDFWYENKNENA
jgi:hypothetical protein